MKKALLLSIMTFLVSVPLHAGSGSVFSVAPGAEGINLGVIKIAEENQIDLESLRNRVQLSDVTKNLDLSDAIVVEGATTISRHYLGQGSTFSVDWDSETVKFEDNSSADFEQVVDEALDIESSQAQ